MANDANTTTDALAAIRKIVEAETRGSAPMIADAMGWPDGDPARIEVTPDNITVHYAGVLPHAVRWGLRNTIQEGLEWEGFREHACFKHVRIKPEAG